MAQVVARVPRVDCARRVQLLYNVSQRVLDLVNRVGLERRAQGKPRSRDCLACFLWHLAALLLAPLSWMSIWSLKSTGTGESLPAGLLGSSTRRTTPSDAMKVFSWAFPLPISTLETKLKNKQTFDGARQKVQEKHRFRTMEVLVLTWLEKQ